MATDDNSEDSIVARLRAGLAHHQAGRLNDAARAYADVLARDPQNGDAHNLMCAIALQAGDAARALEHGRAATAAQDDQPLFWNNFGAALRRTGDTPAAIDAFARALALDEGALDPRLNLASTLADAGEFARAVDILRAAVERAPTEGRVHLNLGNVLRGAGDGHGAVAAWRRACELQPGLSDAWTNLVGGLMDARRFDECAEAYEGALAAGAASPDLHANMARAELARGRLDAAQSAAMSGLGQDSGHVDSAIVLAAIHLDAGDVGKAKNLAQQTTEAAPKRADAWNVLAAAFDRSRQTEEAVAAYEKAIEMAPDNIEARKNLADIFERTNRLERAQALVDRVLEAAPDDAFVNRVAATLARRNADAEGGIGRLARFADLPAPPRVLQGVHFELGRLYDRSGDPDRAFQHFSEGNRIQFSGTASSRADPAQYLDEVRQINRGLSADWVASWTAAPEPVVDAPVFLVGFPRSGTTLLDQILDSHPRVQVIEEQPMLEDISKHLGPDPAAMMRRLAELEADEIEELRSRYFAHAARYVDRQAGALLVDKLPLNLARAPVAHRLFPDARFILALRHPADCVLSCFMQSFRPNIAMNNFDTPENGARLYDLAFELWEHARRLFGLRVHQIRYEDLVADFRPEVERLLDYAGNAERRGRINTPSYNQVTEPIYTRAAGRWVGYRDHMREALEILEPWIARYGYDS